MVRGDTNHGSGKFTEKEFTDDRLSKLNDPSNRTYFEGLQLIRRIKQKKIFSGKRKKQ